MPFCLWKKRSENVVTNTSPRPKKLKVVVVAFEDNCPKNCGELLADALRDSDWLEVTYYPDTEPKTFLNLQQGSFFDLLENGEAILKKTEADVLVWGLKNGARIRLNFQKAHHYETPDLPFFSLLNSLYLPFDYFRESVIPNSALYLIEGAILAVSGDLTQKQNLNEIIEKIGQTSSPTGLTAEDMPYVLNLLLNIYIQAKINALTESDTNLILELLRKGFAVSKNHKDMLCLGCFYANAGQFFSVLSVTRDAQKPEYHHKAIDAFRYARKYFNRYNYPYDFAVQSYQLSQQFFEFWRWTNDMQALRDSVSALREAEKILTKIRFPLFFAEIQHKLGYYLSVLGSLSQNDEILMLAIDHYKNRQKIYTQESDPLIWAECAECIGSILYTIGKMHSNEEYLQESIKYYGNAADIYEEWQENTALRQMQVCRAKSESCIERLQNKP